MNRQQTAARNLEIARLRLAGATQEEIAAKLGMSRSAVGGALMRARDTARERLKRAARLRQAKQDLARRGLWGGPI